MEGCIKIMKHLSSQIEKGRSNFKKSPKDRITEAYVLTRLESLETIINKFSEKHEYIIATYEGTDDYIESDIYNTGYEMYLNYKTELKSVLKILLPSTSSASTPASCKENKEPLVRLPKISIPMFSGKYTEWSCFKDLFTSLIHNNSALDDVQRLHYLKTQVKGEAEQLIRHIPITHDNYKKCWKLLQDRYDNKRYLSNCILRRLFNQKSMNSESAQALKDLVDTTSDCIHELTNLDIKVGTWDVIIIYIISQKLDAETRKQWEIFVNNCGQDLPSFNLFKEFIESRYRALEFVEPIKGKSKPNCNHTQLKVLHTTSISPCPHCNDDHKLYSCSKFASEGIPNRQNIVKTLGLCFNCLGSGHSGKTCRGYTRCRICKRKHHTLLHGNNNPLSVAVATEQAGIEQSQPELSNDMNKTTNIVSHFVTGKVSNQTLLATALIGAESTNGSPLVLRALLDQGSQASFISEAAVQLLRLNKIAETSSISGLGGGQSGGLTSKYVVKVKIQSLSDPTFKLQVKAHVLQTVTAVLPQTKFRPPIWTELGRITLADPQYNSPNRIDILLGSEVYCSILKKGLIKSPNGLVIAQDTHFGWVLSGQVDGYDDKEAACHNVIMNFHVQLEENKLLQRFWEIESDPSPNKNILTSEEQDCENHFRSTTRRDETGRYVVELPFRPNARRDYGDTRSVAVKRLFGLEKRLEKNSEMKKNYSLVIDEYLKLGHMEKVDGKSSNIEGKVWLPHHAVIRLDKSTTQTRVVFNAADRSANGSSLNDTLMVGPTIQMDLRHLIMRWRLHPICLTADIVKMYRQVKLAEKHVDFQRIVWRSEKGVVQDYRLLTVTFGTSCAPYLAVKALQQVALDEGRNFPRAASRVLSDFYMDDLLSGAETEEEAIAVFKEMNELLSKGGFQMQKWASNRVGLLDGNEANSVRELKENDVTKIVGIVWNRRTDDFGFNIKISSAAPAPETKREVISEICRLYDPLGWIAPCIIRAKIFIQKLWIAGLSWDDKLQPELIQEWYQYRSELKKLELFQVPRWVCRRNSDVKVELHGFSDASCAAYAAVVYIRCVTIDNKVYTHLVTAKTKVAPIKQISIPRLELCAAVLVTKLLLEVSETLKIDKTEIHAWTDSTIVLAWLADHPSRWKTFVANRTSEIFTSLDAAQWSYVQTNENPADCASRGVSPTELLEHTLWKNGPSWLQNSQIEYVKPRSICTKTELEKRQIKVHTACVENCEELEDIRVRFSSLRKLIRVIAYCKRFLSLKNKSTKESKPLPYLTAMEIQEALESCIIQHQRHWFHDEINMLLENKNISSKSKLITLNPFIDSNVVLRVGGRIEKSYLPDCSKHPFIVSGESHLAKLMVADAHEKTLHGGQQLTCNYIRSKYWITKAKNLVRSHIHKCIPCVRNAAKIRTQLMGQLPSCRITPQKPFLQSGVDYAGPINIRVSKGRGHRSYKGYICLFVCMATRAVHIEAVSDLTSQGFLSAFKRFVARRGRCNHLWSDNGTNFVGAAKELKLLLSSERSSFPNEVATSLANNGTEWHFIPPHAPNFGGLWESGIKSTKHHLRRVIGEATLTYEELATVLSQIEACLNSRPISQASSDSDDPAPLTPGNFLVGESLVVVPDHNYEFQNLDSLRRWQLTQRMVQSFWRRWSREYLNSFLQRYKWKVKSPQMKIGDIVLVREDNLPPAKWMYGRIEQVHPGQDDLTRVVTLRYKNSLIQRPISKLCSLHRQTDEYELLM